MFFHAIVLVLTLVICLCFLQKLHGFICKYTIIFHMSGQAQVLNTVLVLGLGPFPGEGTKTESGSESTVVM